MNVNKIELLVALMIASASSQLTAWGQTDSPVIGSFISFQESASPQEPGSQWEPEPESESENPYDEPMETDRHDFTQSPEVVGRGVGQLEYGFFYAYKEDGIEVENSYATPELLLRYGLTDRLEIRTRFNYAWKQPNHEEHINGFEDVRLSIKYQIAEHCGFRPATAVEVRSSAPSGGNSMTTGRWRFGLDYIYGWKIGENFTFTGSTGGNGNGLGDVAFVDPDPNRDDNFIAWTQSAALGAKLSNKVTGYFEWFGVFTQGRDEEKSLSFLNVGVDYLVNKNMILDIRYGWGLNAESDDLFAGVGGGFRF